MKLKTLFALLATLAASAVMVGSASAAGPFTAWSTPINNNTIANGNGLGGPGSFQHLRAGTSDSGSGPATSLDFTVYDGVTTVTIPGVETSSNNYEADFDTRPYPNGTTLTFDMVATNAGGTSTPEPLTHVVQNSAPTAFWNSPVANTTNPLSLSVFVGATSFAASGVTFSVEGGASLGAGAYDGTNSYVLGFDPTQYPDGPVTIDAIAHSDGAGNANSDSVVASRTFTILSPDTTNPVISGLMTPADNEVVSGNYILRVHATDDRGVLDHALFSIDGGQTWTLMQNQGNGNFLTHVDTTVLPNDSDLGVMYEVFDPAGNQADADVLATVGNPAPPTIDPTSLVVTQNGSLDLSGPTQVGDFLYARDMTATGYPAPVITYTYRICTLANLCTDVVTDGTYTVQPEDAGDFISLIAKATNTSATSSRGVQFTFVEFAVFVEPTGPQSGDEQPAAPAPVVTPAPVVVAPVVAAPVASGTPASSGTVTSDDGTTVTWAAGTFSAPVTVSVTQATGLGKTTLGVGTTAVELTIKNAAGAAVTSFSAPIELVFTNVPANAVPAYSHDGGLTWTAIPLIAGTTLPAGYTDGYFRDAAGNVHMLTLHATAFGTLAAGSVVTSALQVKVGVRNRLNLNYGHTIAIRVQSTLPGMGTITLSLKGKTIATMKRVLKVGSQVVTLVLPKAARHTGISTLTVRTTANTEHASSTTKIALVARSRK